MTTPLPIPENITIYQLIKQSATLGFMPIGIGSGNSVALGSGFFWTRDEAEAQRTIETLRCNDGSQFFVFELTFPNPAHKKNA